MWVPLCPVSWFNVCFTVMVTILCHSLCDSLKCYFKLLYALLCAGFQFHYFMESLNTYVFTSMLITLEISM